MRPAKLATTTVSLPLTNLPAWQGDASTLEGAQDYLERRNQKSHQGASPAVDRQALSTLVQDAVSRLNVAAPHQPPINQVCLQWGPVDPLSGLRWVDIIFVDTKGRCHDRVWAASEWATCCGVPDAALGQWPLDNRPRRLGGGWERWLRVLASALPFEGPLFVAVPLPERGHHEEVKRPTTQRKGMAPR